MDSTRKGKATEGKARTGYPLAKRFPMANPSMLLPSKPLPPIQKSSPASKPNKICSGEQENGKKGTGCDDNLRNNKELHSEGTGHKASLLYSRGGDVKKGSLGLPVIPPIHKAVRPCVGSAAGSLHSPLQLDVQESQEMRPRSSSRSRESSEHAGLSPNGTAKNLSRSPPSMLLPSKPLPPIRKSSPSRLPSPVCSGEEERGGNGIGYKDSSRNNQEQSSEGKGREASLLYSRGGDVKKGSLGLPVIPPIHKAVHPRVGSAAGSLHSPLQLDVQESQEMRPRSSSRSRESSEHAAQSQRTKGKSPWCVIGPGMPLFPRKLAELFSMETYVRNPGAGNGGLGSRPAQGASAQEPRQGQLSSAAPRVTAREEDKGKGQQGSASLRVPGLPLSQAQETDGPSSPGLRSDKDLRDGFGKIRAALCKLA
ncbi:uncharacterized protein LOC130266652 [Oenanthe melanoleuca]|uniref:uncharacterized protein LOC130266652 n=1 Tax=Oenanthe melanoleuca TaxID=2939378 RepID=UPI0024C20826|nr:uncharacterized protein LOC130266652 [Oenanthe melanoleuca]